MRALFSSVISCSWTVVFFVDQYMVDISCSYITRLGWLRVIYRCERILDLLQCHILISDDLLVLNVFASCWCGNLCWTARVLCYFCSQFSFMYTRGVKLIVLRLPRKVVDPGWKDLTKMNNFCFNIIDRYCC